MSRVSKTLDRVLRGDSDANMRFDDLRPLSAAPGFAGRIRGDHHIFVREGVAEILNIQPRGGQAKAYQVKQIRAVIVAHGLASDPERGHPPGRIPTTRTTSGRRVRMETDLRYEIILYRSRVDRAFLAEVPELPGCMADGATYREAPEHAEVVIREWVETARELGRPVPEPRGRLMYA